MPVICVITGALTVIGVEIESEQPLKETIYLIMVCPESNPVRIPLFALIVATVVLVLDHAPPIVELVKVSL